MAVDEKIRRRWNSVAPRHSRLRTNRRGQFFEGWFYKLVSRENYCVAVIPGTFLSSTNSYDFVQVFDGETNQLWQYEEQFKDQSTDDTFSVGGCRFRPDGLVVDVETAQGALAGEVKFENLTHWNGIVPHPAMGFFSLIPGLQCSHSVISLKHQVEGELTLNGTTIDFSGGYGYLEKTWGRSFPSAWIWSQCCDFDTGITSMFLSAATVPIGPIGFAGLTAAVLTDQNKLYCWGSWRGERARISIQDKNIVATIPGWRHNLEVSWIDAAQIDYSNLNILVPTVDGLQLGVSEGLQHRAEVKIVSRFGGREICKAVGMNTALDLVNLEVLVQTN